MNSNIAERIKLFRLVRDIPYRIGLSLDDADYCCATKAPLFQKLLSTIGVKSRRVYCRFLWKDMPFPRAVIAKSPQPDCLHEYLEVFVPEKKKWVVADPTWDNGMKAAGLTIVNWNGLSATPLAVRSVKFFSPVASAAMSRKIENLSPKEWKDFYKQNRAFFGAINDWMEKNRA